MLLGIALTLNFGLVSATDSSNNTTQNLQTTQTSSVANLATTSTTKVTTTTTKLATTSTASKTTKYAAGSPVSTTSTKTIRVLIYNGNGAITSCVNGVVTALTSANNNNLVPGYRFTYGKSTSITSSILANYDLLVMPGGSSGYTYIHSSRISSSAIKNFISSGHGYLGICAGAYAGSKYVGGSGTSYNGWGVAPHVSSKVYNHEGNLQVSTTSIATQLLGSSGTLTLAHYNGPAFYGSGFTRFANYASGTNSGYAAIVGDTYGNGRTVLSGPHPELSPTNYTLLDQLIVWAANVQTPSSTSYTVSQIGSAAKSVKTYYETYKKLPSYVTISSKHVTMSNFLYLLTSSVINLNSGSTASITAKTVNAPTAPKGTFKHGNILKTEYVKLASNIKNYINTNGRAPNYIATSLGNIRYESTIYMYSKIMNFYYTNKRLPSNVSM
ncbi:hypothetical protein K8N75_11820 [Methanobacterium sp. VT]|uniref:Biotin-protein ligase N-terminal domain-containing protein n=1 Tax=Methanobacterium spitsbergense TaxID=2874285 RepID=A0A8T5V116_9EURY|nr:hypothetical protein [Methanobacterium spitsbergense]